MQRPSIVILAVGLSLTACARQDRQSADPSPAGVWKSGPSDQIDLKTDGTFQRVQAAAPLPGTGSASSSASGVWQMTPIALNESSGWEQLWCDAKQFGAGLIGFAVQLHPQCYQAMSLAYWISAGEDLPVGATIVASISASDAAQQNHAVMMAEAQARQQYVTTMLDGMTEPERPASSGKQYLILENDAEWIENNGTGEAELIAGGKLYRRAP